MKQRVISAIIALAILIPVCMVGGLVYNIAVYAIGMLGLKEFLKVKSTKKELPAFVEIISYVILTLLILSNIHNKELIFSVDFRVIAGLFLVFLIPTVLYHNRSLYSINDAFYLIGGIFFLGASFSLFITIRNISLYLIIYLFLISMITDTYAYLTGMLIGKHKLLETISPKKTLEGTYGGTIFGVFIGTMFYHYVVDPTADVLVITIVTFFLSLLGQFGDLCFSAIKRHFGCKDFSNIMPGHGGVLDRLDSVIFVLLGFMFFVAMI